MLPLRAASPIRGETPSVDGALVIRSAGPDDHDAWLALFDAVAAEGPWIGAEPPIDRRWARRSFGRAVEGRGRAILLAEVDGALVGQVGLTLVGGCVDLGMMVAADHRRRGVGGALVDAAVAWARDHDAHKVTLTVWPHNHAAIALYEGRGFAVEGRLVRHVRRRDGSLWDLVAMGLVLDTTAPGAPPS